MSGHSRNGPSDAYRWSRCLGALEFTKDYPNESSPFADEGTAAHTVREWCLDLGFDAFDFIGTQIKVNGKIYVVDDAMAEHLQPGIDEIREFAGALYVETRVDTTEFVGIDPQGRRQGGTLDAGVVGENLIVISDLKYGEGVAVSPVKNEQQMLYAVSFWSQIARHISNAKKFLIIIDQPRNGAGGGYWTTTLDELLEFGAYIRDRAEKTKLSGAPLTAGEKQCMFCAAANVPGRPGGCPAHAQWIVDQIDMKFSDLDVCDELGTTWQPPSVASLTPERLVQLSLSKKAIEQFLEYAHAQALQHLIDYGPVSGQKAVSGRNPPRKWVDPDAAEAFLRDKLAKGKNPFNEPKLKTPAQAEAEMGGKYKVPRALVEQGTPKPIMVSVEDDRPSIASAHDKFDDETDDLAI